MLCELVKMGEYGVLAEYLQTKWVKVLEPTPDFKK